MIIIYSSIGSLLKIIEIIRQNLPLVQSNEIEWDYKQMLEFRNEFRSIKSKLFQHELNEGDTRKIREIDSMIEELRKTHSELFFKKAENSPKKDQENKEQPKAKDQKEIEADVIPKIDETLAVNYELKRNIPKESEETSSAKKQKLASEVMNAKDFMWKKIYKDLKDLSKDEINKMSIKKKKARLCFIDWMDDELDE